MQNMTLANIAACLNCELHHAQGREQQEITGAVLDSRKVESGYAFFATRGEKVDGHSFIPQVAEKGAALVICEEAPTVEIPYILVEDTFAALKEVAAFYREQLSIPIIGVTGSVGKTSTKEMIAAALSAKFQVLKTQGNFNNEVGLPLTILSIRKEHEAAVVEMGISDFKEMHRLSRIAKPDICVITNIGQCHLENLVDRDGVLKAKTEIFDFMNRDGYVVLNGDDDKLATITEVHGRKPYFFGIQKDGAVEKDVFATEIHGQGLFGSDFKMTLLEEELEAYVPLPGQHMVINALAAASVGRILGMSNEAVLKGIASVQATGGRSNIMKLADKTVIDDCYNANPVSMKSAIDLLMMANGRKVVILGDMFELGTEELALHREVGMYAARAPLDGMIFIGGLAKEMYEGAMKLRAMPEYYPDKESFFAAHKSEDFADRTVLVKASHGMHFEEIVEWLKE
ncbi:MAG: UDP-N-acetylmuramoyl-tripeptide--D-alanyl-D-alanine ligase [Lachnospiraceae bacterium]|nr:UDP-N-acetylmuramoyl-tripeptide--D-alanyl-D-alanine ligase [Lachnospiraceae bacterium]